MSHCWSQDGSEFSTICIAVIAVGIFTSLVSIFCIVIIFRMAKRIRQDHKNNKTSDQIELQECRPRPLGAIIETINDDPDDITP